MVTGWFFLTGLLLRPQLCGEGFVLRGFFKWAALPPKPSEAQVQDWFLFLTQRQSFRFSTSPRVFSSCFFLFIYLFISAGDHASRGFEGCYSVFFKAIPSFPRFNPSFFGLFRLF
jgi:hypothetical protein